MSGVGCDDLTPWRELVDVLRVQVTDLTKRLDAAEQERARLLQALVSQPKPYAALGLPEWRPAGRSPRRGPRAQFRHRGGEEELI